MTLDVEALSGGVGARISAGPGVDLSQLSQDDNEALREAFASHCVLLIRGETLDEAESERLLTRLNEHAIQDRFQYVHRWQAGDLVVFNNTRILHTALGHKRKYRCLLHRTTLRGQADEARAN